MRILFDNGTPRPIAACLIGHEVTRARQIGWHELGNGELIERAEQAGYDLLLSTDKILGINKPDRPQHFARGNSQWPIVRLYLDAIATAVNAATPGGYIEVDIPFLP